MGNLKNEDKPTESAFEREARLNKIALDLYEKCKSQDLTISDYIRMIDILCAIVSEKTKLPR